MHTKSITAGALSGEGTAIYTEAEEREADDLRDFIRDLFDKLEAQR